MSTTPSHVVDIAGFASPRGLDAIQTRSVGFR
jgi:hypothetical protein